MFVTTIVTGAVSIYKPFTLTKRPFMRDVIFYIFAVYLTFYVLWTNTVELYQAIGGCHRGWACLLKLCGMSQLQLSTTLAPMSSSVYQQLLCDAVRIRLC